MNQIPSNTLLEKYPSLRLSTRETAETGTAVKLRTFPLTVFHMGLAAGSSAETTVLDLAFSPPPANGEPAQLFSNTKGSVISPLSEIEQLPGFSQFWPAFLQYQEEKYNQQHPEPETPAPS